MMNRMSSLLGCELEGNVADISNQNSNMDIAISKSNTFLKSFNSSDYFGVGSSDIKFEQEK